MRASPAQLDHKEKICGIYCVAKKAILYFTPKLSHISITEKLYKLSYNVAGKSYG